MLILHNPLQSRHAGRQEMFRGRLVDCHEHPGRFDHVMNALAQRPQGQLATPGAADMALVRRVHAAEYVDFLQNAWAQWVALDAANAALDILPSVWPGHGLRRDVHPANFSAQVGRFAFDSGSPITAGTWEAAEAGAACAIDAARAIATAGGPRAAFALTRPPGHHAGTDFYGGYCFLNNSALAAQALREAGMARVAVLDVDYHHGNGTQQIFYGRSDVLTVSLHGDPLTEYPFYLGYADETGEGEGAGWNLNLPLPAGTGVDAWFDALRQGLTRVAQSGAEALVVALGVDTFAGDPISKFRLQSPDYLRIGRQIAAAGLPTVFVMEGGYAVAEIGVNVVNVLEGFAHTAG
ncbi:histone deacetylase family protein [Acidovorax sp. Leaf160]|uniref:histone deacetylase family protein n=1 Tax=Acidovorax sp. Leaf160 TaxID=1736280 RepID=UPI00070225F4|nr:histone deacetylase family protein [Acidovorax sp. Leaf160]KQR41531.1 acetylpolyamine aminohydrolase [Acidovorax sp. Leaf160]